MVTDFKFEQNAKQLPPILVTDEGMVIDAKLEQPKKHIYPKLVTDD